MPANSARADNKVAHKWEWKTRFRRAAFGWQSALAINRIKQAVTEIKKVAKTDQACAAEGGVNFLERLAPAVERVDDSSGRLGSAIHFAIEELVSIISVANVKDAQRRKWLDRLWLAYTEDKKPSIEILGDYWGELCGTREMSSEWADTLLDRARESWQNPKSRSYFQGTSPCLSALYKAQRDEELFELLKLDRHKLWDYQQFGARALARQGKVEEAINFASSHEGWHIDGGSVANTCEQILLEANRTEEAYELYAIAANRQSSNLNTFRSIKKKYGSIAPTKILQDLVAASPGEEGKWFATAKELKQYEVAIELASKSPCDPRTLMRACADFRESNSEFALGCGLCALKWLVNGYGYEITEPDILDAYNSTMEAASSGGKEANTLKQISEVIRVGLQDKSKVARILARFVPLSTGE